MSNSGAKRLILFTITAVSWHHAAFICISILYPEVGGSTSIRNVGRYLATQRHMPQDYSS
jgi:hypothetical protein